MHDANEHILIMFKLYAQQCGKCCYCGKNCEWENRYLRYNRFKGNAATIEHVYSKWDIRRYAIGGDQELKMSCYRCNQERNDSEIYLLNRLIIDTSFHLITLLKQNT